VNWWEGKTRYMKIYKRDIKKAINSDENRLLEKLENNNKIRRSHKRKQNKNENKNKTTLTLSELFDLMGNFIRELCFCSTIATAINLIPI